MFVVRQMYGTPGTQMSVKELTDAYISCTLLHLITPHFRQCKSAHVENMYGNDVWLNKYGFYENCRSFDKCGNNSTICTQLGELPICQNTSAEMVHHMLCHITSCNDNMTATHPVFETNKNVSLWRPLHVADNALLSETVHFSDVIVMTPRTKVTLTASPDRRAWKCQ